MKCPKCHKLGRKVPNITVKHILKKEQESKIGQKDYYLCTSPECEVGYFNSEAVFDTSAFKRPLWYKKNANPKYAYYCRSITEEEVIKTVLETGLTEAGDLMMHLRGDVDCNCKINNPTGCCCEPAFNEMIQKALSLKRGKSR